MSKSDLFLAFKVGSLVAIVAAFYWQDLAAVFTSALVSSETSYLLAIPLLTFYFVYRKRRVLNAVIRERFSIPEASRDRLPLIGGILLCATAVFLYFYGSYTFTPIEYHMFSLPLFTAGLVIVLFSYNAARHLVFPVAFLFFLMPPPAAIFYNVGSALSVVSAQVSTAIVNVLGMSSKIIWDAAGPIVVMTRPDQTVASFTVEIACSGIYSLIMFLVVGVFLAYLVRDKLWKKVALVAVGFPLIYLLNIARISTLLTVGYYYGVEAAESLFHSVSGLILTFVGALLIVLIAQKLLKVNFYASRVSQSCTSCSGSNSASQGFCSSCGRLLKQAEMKLTRSDVTKIVVATTAVIMLLLVQAPIYALANSPVNILGQLRAGEDPTVQFLPQIDNYTLVYQSRDKAFEAEWQQSGTLLYAYAPNSTSGDIVWVVLEIASTDGSLHNWEYCTVTYPLTQGRQAAVTQLDLRDIAIMDNPPVTARCFAFRSENRNYTQVVVYWRQTLTFTSNTTSEQQYLQINLSIYPNQPGQIQQAENTLQKFAENITAYWQPIKTWLPIALLFSKNADILALSSAFGIGLIVAVARVRYVKTVGMRAENKGGYGKLAENDKKIIGALCLTQRETIPTVNNIAVRYRNLIKQDIDESAVLARLGELNKAGLVYPEIRGVTDYPVLVWRTSDIPAPREL